MGNRGRLHDAKTRTLLKQTWTTNTWIICECKFKGRHRRLMAEGTYTELFFLDEATGFAAGHRPCYECRRPAATAFAAALKPEFGMNHPPTATQISEQILAEVKPAIRRRAPEKRELLDPNDLPDGAMFAFEGYAYLKLGRSAKRWSFGGYGRNTKLPRTAHRLTPKLTCTALAHGYPVHIDESAFS